MSNCEGSRTTPSGCPWDNLLEAAMNLRTKQRSYMADRGNEEKGRAVGDAARVLDDAIEYALVAQSETEPSDDPCTAGLYRLAEECGWHEASSRPPELFIRDKLVAPSAVARSITVAQNYGYGRFDFNVEEYIAGLQWSPAATDHEKTLVAGNLRAMFAVVKERHNNFVAAARDVAAGFESYDNEARSTQSASAGRKVLDIVRFTQAPCYRCGYNGEGYYQPEKHPCAEEFHAISNLAAQDPLILAERLYAAATDRTARGAS